MSIQAAPPTAETAINVALRSMSWGLRAELYRQLVAGNTRFGSNVRVSIPAGSLSDELRRISLDLINTGAIKHAARDATATHKPAHDLSVILHHAMVTALLKQEDASQLIQQEARVRFIRLRPALHRLLMKTLDGSVPKAVFDIHFKDAVSVTDIGTSVSRLFGNYPDPLDQFDLDPDVIRLVRHVIAPYNAEHADVHVIFYTDNASVTLMELNGAPIGR